MGFLDDIPGVKDVIDGTGTVAITLPRRHKIKVLGSVVVVDNPATKTTELTFGLAEAVPIVNADRQGSVPETAGAAEGYTLLVDSEGDVYWGEGTLYDVVSALGDGLAPTTENATAGYVLTVDGLGDVAWDSHPYVNATVDGIVRKTNGASSPNYVYATSALGLPAWRLFTSDMHGILAGGDLHAVAGPTAGGFVPRTAAGATGSAGLVPVTEESGVPVWGFLSTNSIDNDSDVTGSFLTAGLNNIKTALGLCLDNVVIQVLTSASGTYTPTAGMKKCLVVLTGPGGGGGSADTDGSASSVGVASGGSAGATQIKLFDAAAIGASKAYVLPAGGAGGTAGGDGSPGAGNSTFGSTLLVAAFGLGGLGSGANNATAAQTRAAVAGGAAGSEGDLNISGGNSRSGWAASSATCTFGESGEGGASWWGVGAGGRAQAQASLATDLSQAGGGATASHYGAGGAGGINLTAGTSVDGGDGARGVLVVIEFIESAF
jgi:hypothetical protein